MIERYYLRDGNFVVDGVSLADILGRQSTPFYLYSAEVVRDKYRKLEECLRSYDIFYSFKANPNLAICKTVLSLGANADVSSLGELKTALRVGFDAKNILFVGPGKTEEEIRCAVEVGIYALIVESRHELDLVDRIACQLGRRIDVLLRINTQEKPVSAEIMVGGPSKFGFDEERVRDEVEGFKSKYVNLAGIHVYSASQVLDSGLIVKHIEYVHDLALRISGDLDFNLGCVDFGGGFGVPNDETRAELDLEPIKETARSVKESLGSSHPGCRLAFEIGRFLVAQSGIFLTKVIQVKESRGRRYVITDAGMNHFTRPALLRLNHPVRILNKIGDQMESEYDICGPICTPLDVIGNSVRLATPEPGDIVGFFNAGAYGYTMSMINFMSLGWPAELMVDDGKVSLVRKARRAEDLFEDQSVGA